MICRRRKTNLPGPTAIRVRKHLACFVCIALFMSGCIAPVEKNLEPKLIGTVTNYSGFPSVSRDNRLYILANQSKIYEGDILKTDSSSRLHITMSGDAQYQLGPNTHFVFHQFPLMDKPSQDHAKMSFSSGSLTVKPSTRQYSRSTRFTINTPYATLSVRDAGFWAGFIFGNNMLDTVLLDSSSMRVANEHGETVIENPNLGTTIIGHSAPHSPKPWDDKKINIALATTDLSIAKINP